MNTPKTFDVPLHAIVTQYHFVDRSDEHGEIAWEQRLQLHPSEKHFEIRANVVAFERPDSGSGFVWARLAPTAEVRTWDAGPVLTLVASKDGWTVQVEEAANCYEEVTIPYEGGSAGRTRALQRWQRSLNPYKPERDGVLLSNTWGDRSRDDRISEAFMIAEIDKAAELGVEVVQLDDGWEKGRTINSSQGNGVWSDFWATDPDYWSPNPVRFPNGLEPVIAHARKRGVNVGLWYAPDSSGDFSNWEKDAAMLLGFWRKYGVRHFKLDGVKLVSPLCEQRFRALLDRVWTESKGEIVVDLDTTAESRLGFWGRIAGSAIFVENRYTDWRNYYPHTTLRTLWSLAQSVHPMRLRMEFLNNERNDALYAGDPLGPALYNADYLFASVMLSSPLAWFENTGLSLEFINTVKPLVALWKQWRSELYTNDILPVGAQPDGYSWTGFAVVSADNVASHILIFREAARNERQVISLPEGIAMAPGYRLIAGQGGAHVEGGCLHVHLPAPRTFCWLRTNV